MPNVDLTPDKLADIKQKAEAAENCSPSPWKSVKTVEEYHIYCEVRDNNDCQVVCNLTQEEAGFIATANPATVLALVQEIETLKTALNLLMCEYYSTDLEHEDIDKLCNGQIEIAKKHRKSEATQ